MNKGLEKAEVERVKALCRKAGKNFIYNTEEERDENFAHFFFIGKHEGKEAVFNGFMFSLEMEYISTLYDEAQAVLLERMPNLTEEDLEVESVEIIEQIEDIVSELEDAGEIQVQEFVELDDSVEYGVGVNVCLNLLEVTDEDIENFVDAYNNGTLELDETAYSFDFDDEVFEED
jgi:hypothetical protein